MSHRLRFATTGRVDGFYTEAIDLRELGRISVLRATHIEFNPATQEWEVRAAGDGMLLHTHPSRDACVRWEQQHLQPR